MNGITSEIKQVDLNDDVFIKLNNHSKKEKKIPIKKSYLLKKILFLKKNYYLKIIDIVYITVINVKCVV